MSFLEQFKDTPTLNRDFVLIGDASNQFKPIDAIFKFVFKDDYVISVSTAGLSQGACQTEVIVEDIHSHKTMYMCNTVEEAIDFIIGD